MTSATAPIGIGARAPFVRSVARGRCPSRGHHNAAVVGNGTYVRPSGTYQAYRCTPRAGDRHTFSVRLDGGRPVRNRDAAKGAGRGYLSMRRTAPALADVVLRSCLESHRAKGDGTTAALLSEQVRQQARCGDPAITELRATTIAAGGRQADLRTALRVCHAVLANRAGSTDPAWSNLASRAAQIAGRERRLRQKGEGRRPLDERPRSPRPVRFLRVA